MPSIFMYDNDDDDELFNGALEIMMGNGGENQFG
jgi:hypothetical protein